MRQHVDQQAAEYVLDLLPSGERRRVEQHAAECATCREALQRESHLAQRVRGALHTATRPSPARLQQLMPTPPQPRAVHPLWHGWQKQLAPLAVALLLLVSTLGVQLAARPGSWLAPAPALLGATATMTQTPTATLAQTATDRPLPTTQREAAVATLPVVERPSSSSVATPAPNPTPVAAGGSVAAN